MRKSGLFAAACAILVAGLLALASCTPKAKGRVVAEGPVKGDLAVLQATPQGLSLIHISEPTRPY